MLGNAGTYAMKKRKKPVQKPKKLPGVDGVIKSNPSKRHRDRLNGELDRLTDLLPFSEDIRTRLDKLSVLRLSVGYLRVKGFFKATMKKPSVMFPGGNGKSRNGMDSMTFTEGDLLLQALNGFVIVVTAEGLVFYASSTIQDYLGFHQSDVIHQSVYELIHTDDRTMFREQLHFALNPKTFSTEQSGDVSALHFGGDLEKYDPERLPPENSSFLERSFVCRFRCLLDNSSGFLALKFQGRLKYLHGQSMLSEGGIRIQSQLALFSIAVPVQAPSILEIRSKTLIFQTKHKLDFTPTGVDNRGKVVLGYTEIELCMRGSGYQFVHAADMMYCADTHLRMIKTGESGLTVFRLLTKSGSWVWVQSNAKLVYKGGRPDFIIARQRALINAEGEEHLRQRRMQLPFSLTTGEALLYEVGPSLDITQIQANRNSSGGSGGGGNNQQKAGGLLGLFLNQDESVYIQETESQLPVDQAFMDSRALLNVPSDAWEMLGAKDNGQVTVKEEGDRSVVAMIDALENLTRDKDLCSALQGLDVDPTELMEWENTLQKLSQEDDSSDANRTKYELETLLNNDIFAYMDNVLFKDIAETNLNASQSSCLAAVNNDQGEPFAQPTRPTTTGLYEATLFQGPEDTNSAVKGVNAAVPQPVHKGPLTMAGQSPAGPTGPVFNSTQKLSHYGPLVTETNANVPSLQFRDFLSPSMDDLHGVSLPTLSSGGNVQMPFESCGQAPISQTLSNRSLQPCSHNGLQAPPVSAGGHLLQGSVQPPAINAVPSSAGPLGPSLAPQNNFPSPGDRRESSATGLFPGSCLLQSSVPFQTHNNHRVQPWPQLHQQQLHQQQLHQQQLQQQQLHQQQLQQQQLHQQQLHQQQLHQQQLHQQQLQSLPHTSIGQNAHKPVAGNHGAPSENQRLPAAGLWEQSFNNGGLAGGQQPLTSSCMFDKPAHALPHPHTLNNGNLLMANANGTGLVPAVPLCQGANTAPVDHSPPQGSCHVQWGPSEPLVGTSAIAQDSTAVSPVSLQPGNISSHAAGDVQTTQYLNCNKHPQMLSLPAEEKQLLAMPPLVDGNLYFADQSQLNLFVLNF